MPKCRRNGERRRPPPPPRGSGGSSGGCSWRVRSAPPWPSGRGLPRPNESSVTPDEEVRDGHDCARSSTSRHSGRRSATARACSSKPLASLSRSASTIAVVSAPASRSIGPLPAGRSPDRDRRASPDIPRARRPLERSNRCTQARAPRRRPLAAPRRGTAVSAARPLPASRTRSAWKRAASCAEKLRSPSAVEPTRLAAIACGPKGTATGGISRITLPPPLTSHRRTRGDRREPR